MVDKLGLELGMRMVVLSASWKACLKVGVKELKLGVQRGYQSVG